MKPVRKLSGAALAAAALFAGSAGAAVIPFSFTGTNRPLSVVGTLTTTGVPNGVFGEDVTAMSGTVDGSAFTFIPNPDAPNAVNTPDNAFNYDDNFDVSTSSPDAAGLLFSVGNIEYNLYDVDGVYSVLSYTAGATAYNPQVNGVFAVPEPESWALMILGGFALGLVLRSRRTRSAESVAPCAANA
ncbi:MAG: PEP-CTERM sorting domain-containing protein [Caulobacteraceae bacterium]